MRVVAILLGSVKVPYEEIRRRIVEVDEENLTAALMEQLIKYLPSHDQMNQLAGLSSQYAQLAEPEQFVVVVCIVCFVKLILCEAVFGCEMLNSLFFH